MYDLILISAIVDIPISILHPPSIKIEIEIMTSAKHTNKHNTTWIGVDVVEQSMSCMHAVT